MPRLRRTPIRVLVVDDSAVTRRIVAKALEHDGSFRVVGSVPDAETALERLPFLRPDVMTLDIHMEGMTGLELLPIVRQRYPDLRVLIFSSSGEGGAATTVDALLRGATGFMMKPFGKASGTAAMDGFRLELASHIKSLFAHTAAVRDEVPLAGPQIVRRASSGRRAVLAVGVSTGGPNALAQLLEALPRPFALPLVIVQHMPRMFTRLLAERLRATTGFPIVEAVDGMRLEAGKAILAPGDFHMRLAHERGGMVVRLDQGEPECSCRPSVDVLFRSVAEVFGGDAIATVLTGMGQDGLRGATALHHRGAHLIAQDQATSVVWGMPGAVAPFADEILPLDRIASAIVRETTCPTRTAQTAFQAS